MDTGSHCQTDRSSCFSLTNAPQPQTATFASTLRRAERELHNPETASGETIRSRAAKLLAGDCRVLPALDGNQWEVAVAYVQLRQHQGRSSSGESSKPTQACKSPQS